MKHIGENMARWNLYTLLLRAYNHVAHIKISIDIPQKMKSILDYYMTHLYQRILNKVSLSCEYLHLLLL